MEKLGISKDLLLKGFVVLIVYLSLLIAFLLVGI
jgi:hypothetical protein